MLIEFTVGNFRSFKDPVTLSMVATRARARDPQVNKNNTIEIDDKLSLLTSAAVYGANASGKSNLVAAIRFMRNFMLGSSKDTQAEEAIPVVPFLLSTETDSQPSFFEIVFLIDGQPYRYGFEATNDQVYSEWLFYTPTQREVTLFLRDEDGIDVKRSFKEGRDLEDKTRPNALFLSVVAQFNGPIAKKILQWVRNVGIISGLDDQGYRRFTVRKFRDGSYREQILQLVKRLDLDIDDLGAEEIAEEQVVFPEDLSPDLRRIIFRNMKDDLPTILAIHTKRDLEGRPVGQVEFPFNVESDGTQKLFSLAGPIVDTFLNGQVIIIDEMEARLHPLIMRALIQLFNSPETNPRRAQLILTTHDTNILSNQVFRRDQIWFVEKNRFGATDLYSLAELKVRNDASFEDDYIQGRYGAIPFLGDLRQVVLCDDEEE